MALSLPQSIATYFEVSNGADTTRFTECFAAEASVLDEGSTHRGYSALQSWIAGTRKAFEYTVEPVELAQKGNLVTVIATVRGNFPGSPVRLEHVFRMACDKIKSLEIH